MLYKILGFFFLGLGFIGVFLPVFPTVPFVILSAACFARSSEKWHNYLLSNRYFGDNLRNWEENRCISNKARVIALVSMWAGGSISMIFFINDMRVRIAMCVVFACVSIYMLSIKTCEDAC